jgi:hypothetical protein
MEWSRQQGLRLSRDLSQEEQLAHFQERARAIQEVSEAVAWEELTGESSLGSEGLSMPMRRAPNGPPSFGMNGKPKPRRRKPAT